MCRWFAYISEKEECLLEDVLITPSHAITKQVHDHYLPLLLAHDPNNITTEHEIAARNKLFNVDGFGLAWYTSARNDFSEDSGTRPALYKNSQPPTNDMNFHTICANTSTTAVFAHIRAATSTPIVSVNNHPFSFGRHVIMHNGVVADFLAIKREMGSLISDDAYANISGSTDSEHLAALYITYLTNGRDRSSWEKVYTTSAMKAALSQAISTIIRLQQKTLGSKAEANSLNVAVTDGERLIAFRYRNHETEQPPSLYYSCTAGVTLNRKYPDHPDGKENVHSFKKMEEHESHVIVASEPTTYKKEQWTLIEKNCCVV